MDACSPHDVIVVGLGGMGAAVLEACSRRGLRALGLEHHGVIRHGKGRSHASSRGFRQTYADATLRELSAHSRAYWMQLPPSDTRRIFEPCGATISAPATHPMLGSVRAAARSLGAVCTTYPEARQRAEFPGLPEGFETLFEPDAGWIRASAAVGAMSARAERQGAQVRCRATVRQVVAQQAEGGAHMARVQLSDGQELLSRAVVLCTAGHVIPVTGEALAPLHFRRQVEHWFDMRAASQQAFFARNAGMFHVLDLPTGEDHGTVNLYGMLEQPGLLKCCVQRARHDRRHTRASDCAPVSDEDLIAAHDALAALWPEASARAVHLRARVGWNVETGSGDFLYGPLAHTPHIIRAQAFCGHGFKMFPALAERICDLLENLGE